MTSQIALAPAVDTPALCDRCAAAMTPGDFSLDRLRLRGARLLVDKIVAVEDLDVRRVSEHILAPANDARTRATYGIEARVLACGPDISPEDIRVGDRVIIDEFAGRPIFWNDTALPYWIVGDGEVMVILRDDEAGDVA